MQHPPFFFLKLWRAFPQDIKKNGSNNVWQKIYKEVISSLSSHQQVTETSRYQNTLWKKDCSYLFKEFFFSWNLTEDITYLGFIQCLLKLKKKNFTLQENAKTIYRTYNLYLLCSKNCFSVFMKTFNVLAWNHFFQTFWLNLPKGLSLFF